MTHPSRHRLFPPCGRRATVLVIVMWIAFGLVSLALYFGNTFVMEYRAADNALAGAQAEQAIEAARRYIEYVLTNYATDGNPPSLDDDEYVAEAVEVGEARFWLVGRDPDADSYTAAPTKPCFGLMDESAKLPMNADWVDLSVLELLPNITDEIAAAIIDWKDDDEDVTTGGAESQEYELLDEPYTAKNSSYETPEELRLVMNMTPTLLYGEDANRNGALDPNEDDGEDSWPPDDKDGKLDCGLVEYLTPFTRDPDDSTSTEAKVNVRTAPLAVLACLPGMDSATAEKLVQARASLDESELESTDWVSSVAGSSIYSSIEDYITAQSYQYAADIVAVGHDGRGFRRSLMVFDISASGEVKVIYRRDLTRFGWPLGQDLRRQLAQSSSK